MNPSQASLLPESAHARHGDPSTSHEAATSVKDLNEVQRKVRACLISGPAHDEEIIRRFRHYWPASKTTDSSIRSRRAELVNPRWPAEPQVEWTGEYATTESGGKTKVWRLK